jgi:hypothetical protein
MAETLSQLFASGRIIDVVLAVMAVEAVLLLALRPKLAGRLAAIDIVLILVPGLCLLLAMRASLSGAGWEHVAAWLVAALLAHLADLARRITRT